jgi:OOP family OmpA-OmpF porin
MKKLSLLVVALVLALPGCGCRKKESAKPVRSNAIETHMDVNDDMPEDGDEEEFDGYEDDADLEDVIDLDELADGEDADEDYMDNIAFEDEDADQAFNWIDAQADDEFKRIYFSFNHYGIRQDQKEALSHDIEQVKQIIAESDSVAQATVVIEGHACQEGDPAYNVPLSEKRAKVVADMFVAAGIDRNAIKVVGRGQECPVVINGKAVNGSREDRAPNRRVEVRVIYT